MEWYDKLSSRYEDLYGSEQSAKHQHVLDLLNGQEFGLAVDAACGTGTLLQKVKGKCQYLVGVDLSRRMISMAKQKLRFDNADLIRADCCKMPLTPGAADLLLAISLLEANGDAGEKVLELARTTKPDGNLVVTVFHPEEEPVDPAEMELKHVKHRAELSSRESLFQARNLRAN